MILQGSLKKTLGPTMRRKKRRLAWHIPFFLALSQLSRLWSVRNWSFLSLSPFPQGSVGETFVSFVISLDTTARSHYGTFQQRNPHLAPAIFEATDGFNQTSLDWFGKVANLPPLNASNPYVKTDPQSPHAVGCYLSHWRLLQHIAIQKYSQPVWVFEDDALCAPGLLDHVASTVLPTLPDDWDILYAGGHPVTTFLEDTSQRAFSSDSNPSTLARDVCRGDFGRGNSPLAPNRSRHLDHPSHVYWKTLDMDLTHSYLVNPKRLDRWIQYIRPTEYIPIDWLYTKLMQSGKLNAYMTTQQFCRQGLEDNDSSMEATHWSGYFVFQALNVYRKHPALRANRQGRYVWQDDLVLKDCLF